MCNGTTHIVEGQSNGHVRAVPVGGAQGRNIRAWLGVNTPRVPPSILEVSARGGDRAKADG
jgi:hypothetical protein